MSGGTDIFTSWQTYIDGMIDEDEIFKFICTLARLKIVDFKAVKRARERTMNNIFGAQS